MGHLARARQRPRAAARGVSSGASSPRRSRSILATYGCQAWRWQLLLGNAGRLSWLAAARIIFIGLFVSEVLPMRPGEGVRAWLAARRLGVRVAAIVPSIVVERFFDSILLVASIATMALVAPLPPALAMASRVLGLIVIAARCGACFTLLVRGHLRANHADAGSPGSAIRSAMAEIASGIHAIGVARTTAAAFALSCALLAGQIAAFWLAMRACGIDRSCPRRRHRPDDCPPRYRGAGNARQCRNLSGLRHPRFDDVRRRPRAPRPPSRSPDSSSSPRRCGCSAAWPRCR